MAVITLDPKTALIVIDLQNGIVALPTVHPAGEVVKYASALADAFRRHGLPVVLVSVAGAPSGRTERARSVAQLPGAKTVPTPSLS
jgi:nicotinamidase-related amidase